MSANQSSIVERYIYPAIDEMAASMDPGHGLHKSPDTRLFGADAALDSLGLVNFVAAARPTKRSEI